MVQTTEAPLLLARQFRQVLEAMARPGRVFTLADAEAKPPLNAATAAVISVLSDRDAPVWLTEDLRLPTIERFLRFETGTGAVATPSEAAFLVGDWMAMRNSDIPLGTPEYPDRGATLVLSVPHLKTGHGRALTGPGIETIHHLDCGLPDEFWAARAANHTLYPLGWDVLLTCDDRLAALPRTTQAED